MISKTPLRFITEGFKPKFLWGLKLSNYTVIPSTFLIGVFHGKVVLFRAKTWAYLSEIKSKEVKRQVIRSFLEKGELYVRDAHKGFRE